MVACCISHTFTSPLHSTYPSLHSTHLDLPPHSTHPLPHSTHLQLPPHSFTSLTSLNTPSPTPPFTPHTPTTPPHSHSPTLLKPYHQLVGFLKVWRRMVRQHIKGHLIPSTGDHNLLVYHDIMQTKTTECGKDLVVVCARVKARKLKENRDRYQTKDNMYHMVQ